ncbi:MAG: hypothetical protein WBV22_12135 [Anaerolineaceae bacterium]
MISKKFITLFVLIIVLTMLPLSSVLAAPSQQVPTPPPPVATEPIVGTIDQIVIQGDPASGTAIVVVTLTDADGIVQTVKLTLDAATSLGLVITNPDGTVVVDETLVGTEISIDPTLILPVVDNKVANAIADFLATMFDTDASVIMGYHEDGMGFGVIAQAGFMALALKGDEVTMKAILEAKKNGTFSTLVLPDGIVVNSWGELRKAVLTDKRSATNLGAIMSGRATDTPKEHGKPAPKDNHGKKK